ncbi:MAG TPA: RNA polymerase sigma factor [Acidobacteriota bacterium]|nr:RNA polymerase sigma factor [Acidobacteriota bacterium]
MQTKTALPLPQPALLSDEEIVSRILAGETGLFEIIMRRYNQRLYRTIRAILGSDDEVEDIMQDVYVLAFRKLSQFEHRSSLATWLTRIAVNLSLSKLRRRRGDNIYPIDTEQRQKMNEKVRDRNPSPEKQAFNREIRDLVESVIERMPAKHRSVLVLRDVEGLSTAEVATLLGMSTEAVKVNLHRARRHLREAIERRSGETISQTFAFEAPRCDRVVARVMSILNG